MSAVGRKADMNGLKVDVRSVGSAGIQVETPSESANLQAGLGAPRVAIRQPYTVGVSMNVLFCF
jgi:hypothetical protein